MQACSDHWKDNYCQDVLVVLAGLMRSQGALTEKFVHLVTSVLGCTFLKDIEQGIFVFGMKMTHVSDGVMIIEIWVGFLKIEIVEIVLIKIMFLNIVKL